ncbi:phosphotransferase [Plantactinospora sp. KLBMP9567]|uniref:phosphotransferase n=1 Tax=Plantactinospora sp. KLBMP9567 TaxID=3085900 RepID=UPI0029815E15|nr:phosphotransferase [Plantactinospora sp. KLBMP9567]MDW5328842.1 phosphotransferase [Plantactinospora sp. KLBMP9567]
MSSTSRSSGGAGTWPTYSMDPVWSPPQDAHRCPAERNRPGRDAAARPSAGSAAEEADRTVRRTAVFTHGDLQVTHVSVDTDEITGVVDRSEAGQGDALYDLGSLTLGHEEHLGDVITGHGTDIDLDVIRAWWSLRSLRAVRWLVEHGLDPWPEIAVLKSRR